MKEVYAKDAKIFKAFCDAKRLYIVDLLRSGEKCACVLIERTGIAQSALSYHMKILIESGIVKGRQDGKWIHYSLSDEGIEFAKKRLNRMTQMNNMDK